MVSLFRRSCLVLFPSCGSFSFCCRLQRSLPLDNAKRSKMPMHNYFTVMLPEDVPSGEQNRDDQPSSELTSTVLFPDLSIFEDENDSSEDDERVTLSQWALVKIGTFQSRLEMVLRNREQRGQKKFLLSSVATAELLRLANEVFGFNGWSSQIISCEQEEEKFDQEKSVYSMKHVATVRLILQDGVFIDAQGTGESTNIAQKHICLSNCKKMAITNGIRNGLLGLKDMLFTHEELIKVEKIKREFN